MDKETRPHGYSLTEKDIAVWLTRRSEWGAVDARSKKEMGETAKRVVIHHTAIQSASSQECREQVIHIQKMHMTDRHFDDIGYNFLISQRGMVFEGRGWGVVGAHTKGHNQDSIGIAIIGNFNYDVPTSAALSSVKRLLHDGVHQGALSSTYTIFGHRDLANTECPGNKLYPEIQRLTSDKD